MTLSSQTNKVIYIGNGYATDGGEATGENGDRTSSGGGNFGEKCRDIGNKHGGNAWDKGKHGFKQLHPPLFG